MYFDLTDKKEMAKITKRYNQLLIKVWFKIPPIIYHYKAKNELRFNGKYFYYVNPRWVTKFRTRYRMKDMLSLIDDLKTNQRISWNN
jgi:hypothetical protein